MEAAYSLKDLGEKLKAAGVPVLEEAAEATAGEVYKALKAWAAESAALSKTPYDDLVIPFFAQLDTLVLPQIDKIDGEQG